jgi:hypothetical protein
MRKQYKHVRLYAEDHDKLRMVADHEECSMSQAISAALDVYVLVRKEELRSRSEIVFKLGRLNRDVL